MNFKNWKNQESSSKSKYLKLKDGESVVGVFLGDPYDFRIHGWGKETKLCLPDVCADCIAGNKSSFRFRINFLTKENEELVIKIFEQGKQIYKMLQKLNEEYPLEKTTVRISREGSSKEDTSYSIVALDGGELSDSELEQVSSLTKHDLIFKERPY